MKSGLVKSGRKSKYVIIGVSALALPTSYRLPMLWLLPFPTNLAVWCFVGASTLNSTNVIVTLVFKYFH